MDSTPNTGGVVESTMQPRLSGSAAARVNVEERNGFGDSTGGADMSGGWRAPRPSICEANLGHQGRSTLGKGCLGV